MTERNRLIPSLLDAVYTVFIMRIEDGSVTL